MQTIKKCYVIFEKFIPGLFFISIFLVMMLEIGARAIANKSFEWNTEYCRYALVWVTFLGAVYVRRERSHIEVAALYEYFIKKNMRKTLWVVDFIRQIVLIGFWVVLAWFGYEISQKTQRFSSSAMGISQFYLYICTSYCGILGLIMELGALFRLCTKGWEAPPKVEIEQIMTEG